MSLPSLRQDLFLIGDVDTQINGNKLPSKAQVLKVLFFNMRFVKLSLHESAKLVIKEVLIFWNKAHLPTQKECNIVGKLKKLYVEWRTLQKGAGKPFNLENEKTFKANLGNLFDIAHANIDGMIDDLGRDFLADQRKDGRIGYIGDVESSYDILEKAQLQREELQAARLAKNQEQLAALGKLWIFIILLDKKN